LGGYEEGDGDINSVNLMTEPMSAGVDKMPSI
jgi:adenylylsulfate reductase subunit B